MTMAISEFGDVTQVVATGLALAALGTAAEQYIIQNLIGNRRVILNRQNDHETSNNIELNNLRELCFLDGKTPQELATIKGSFDQYDRQKEDLIAIDVQEELKMRLPLSQRFGLRAIAISATYTYITAAVIYSIATYFSGIHLTKMDCLFAANSWLLDKIGFPYTIDAILNVSIITLTFQTILFSRFMWKSIRLRSQISAASEDLRGLGESILGQTKATQYVIDNQRQT